MSSSDTKGELLRLLKRVYSPTLKFCLKSLAFIASLTVVAFIVTGPQPGGWKRWIKDMVKRK